MAVNPVVEHPGFTRPPRADRVEVYGSAVGDAVDGAFAVLAVAAVLVRYATEVAGAGRRRALARLPFTGQGTVLRRAFHGPVARLLAHPASAAVRAVSVAADAMVPELARAVLARIDVPALVREFVDLDRLAMMLDVDAVVARVDLDAVLERVDIDAIAGRLDLNAVVARLDLDTVVDKVDVARVVDRVDLDAIVARVDLDRAVDRVDLDRAVDRVDIDRVLSRTDLAGLARYVVEVIDLPGLLRASTGSVTTEVVRSVRDQGADADRAVERVVDRLLRRQARRTETAGSGP